MTRRDLQQNVPLLGSADEGNLGETLRNMRVSDAEAASGPTGGCNVGGTTRSQLLKAPHEKAPGVPGFGGRERPFAKSVSHLGGSASSGLAQSFTGPVVEVPVALAIQQCGRVQRIWQDRVLHLLG